VPPDFNLPFVLSVFGAFVASTVMARLYVWPVLRSMPRYDALRVLAALSAFRFEGMNFMVAGFVSPQLPSWFGSQVGWGDFTAAVLALLSMAALTWRWTFALPIVWIFNLEGAADLLQGRDANCRPGTLRRRYLHSDRLCSDTAHQPHACFHDPFEGAIGSKKIVTRAAPAFHSEPLQTTNVRTTNKAAIAFGKRII
jgi:hypothetical protein